MLEIQLLKKGEDEADVFGEGFYLLEWYFEIKKDCTCSEAQVPCRNDRIFR